MSALFVYLGMLVAGCLCSAGAYRLGFCRGVEAAAPIAYDRGRRDERADNEKEAVCGRAVAYKGKDGLRHSVCADKCATCEKRKGLFR